MRDSSGRVVRVALGPGDVDCRPWYRADPGDWIVKALVAAEDGTFFSHCGVRPLSIARAAFQNITGGRRVSGASTLSMQTVRLIEPHRKSYLEKWVEAVKAIKMERKKDKLWILSQYLNRAPFGSNFIGIEAASLGWFGKDVKKLGIGEAALLAGMVQAPSRFRPDRGYERAVKRRDYVLERMLKLGFITAEQMEDARTVRPKVQRAPRPFEHPYYCDWWIADWKARHGGAELSAGDWTMPLDADVQAACENAVEQAAAEGKYRVAAAVMDVASGNVVALACSGGYFSQDAGQVNTAMSPRPAGSTLKPFLAAQALDLGIVRPDEKILDAPRAFDGWAPANFDGKYRGMTSLADALVMSLNIPFVSILEKTGVGRFGSLLGELGFSGASDAEKCGLGLAIGNMETTLVELLSAYRRLALAAAGGDAGGPVSREAAYLVSVYLSGEERSQSSLGHRASVEAPRFAWKTGTSSAYRDAWTVAWNPQWTVAVWCGHVQGGFGDTSVVGLKAAAPVAWNIARSLYPGNRGPWFERPCGLADCDVCEKTGLAAGPWCKTMRKGVSIGGRSARGICEACRDGEKTKGLPLAIAKPRNGAVFRLVDASLDQKIRFKPSGNPEDMDLWWFVDGKYAGKTRGAESFFIEPEAGNHTVSCSDANGRTAETSINILP